jgi:hypothetical protein
MFSSLLQEEFDEQCHETQVGPILDTVEELVEEQSLDPLFSDKYVSCILVNPFCLLLSIYGIGLNCKSSPHILEFWYYCHHDSISGLM